MGIQLPVRPPAVQFGKRLTELSQWQKENATSGATGDPIHLDHMNLIEEAGRQAGIEDVTFFIAAHPPLKPDQKVESFEDRMAVAKLVFKKLLGWVTFSERERDISSPQDPSYTVKTLRDRFPGFDELHKTPERKIPFIMGADAIRGLPKWEEGKTLAKNCVFVVGNRNNLEIPDSVTIDGEAVEIDYLPIQIEGNYRSSSEIREKVKAGISRDELAEYVGYDGADYILERGLYQED